jgi:hypothetical protein
VQSALWIIALEIALSSYLDREIFHLILQRWQTFAVDTVLARSLIFLLPLLVENIAISLDMVM